MDFEDIDLTIMVGKVVDGTRVPLPLLIKKTNEKTVEAIHAEIQAARRQEIRDESDHVLTEDKMPRSAIAMHNLCFAFGSVAKKPWVVANRIEIRDILHLTALFDHDAVDGAPAARFVARLVSRIQSVVL